MNGNELEEIKEPIYLLDYLDQKYLVFNNIVFLQGLFLMRKAPDLCDRCLEYAINRGKEKHILIEAKILKQLREFFLKTILSSKIQVILFLASISVTN